MNPHDCHNCAKLADTYIYLDISNQLTLNLAQIDKMLQRPQTGKFPEYFSRYTDRCPDDILPYLTDQKNSFLSFLSTIPQDKHDFAYEKDKWTLKQSIIHLVETEKIFAYRSLATSRAETQLLNGFDQDDYVTNHNSAHISWDYIMKDLELTRDLSNHLFQGYNDAQWLMEGNVGGNKTINTAFPFMVGGHMDHHLEIIKSRYL